MKSNKDLILLDALVIALIITVTFIPDNILRTVLGVMFVAFLPGYAIIAALFPARETIKLVERVALSLGVSIAVVPIIGLILNYLPWGIMLEPVLYTVSAVIIVTSGIAWFRRQRLPEAERFNLPISIDMGHGSKWHKVGYIALILVVLVALGWAGSWVAGQQNVSTSTGFYLLGANGRAADYPAELAAGETAEVTAGIVNHEDSTASYRVVVESAGVVLSELGPISLAGGEKYEEIVSFTLNQPGENVKVEFSLYREGESEPYSSPLYLWIDVTE